MMTSTRWKLTQTSEFELEHALRNLDSFKNILILSYCPILIPTWLMFYRDNLIYPITIICD